NGHAQVFDGVGVWLGVAGQEIAGERAEGVVQLAACFGGNSIENDRRFTRPGHTGKDSDFALRNAQRYILQVVFTCAAYRYIFLGHYPLLFLTIDHSTTSIARPGSDFTLKTGFAKSGKLWC